MSTTPIWGLNLIGDGNMNWGALARQNYEIIDSIVPAVVPFPQGRWYPAGQANATALTTGAPTANNLRAMPFMVWRTLKLDRIAINVTTASSGNARFGIYADSGAVLPEALLVDAGQVDTGATGVKELTIDQTLSPGLYWLALVGSAAPTIRCLSLAGCMAILGVDGALGTAPGVGYVVSFTYGSLPATFPASPSIITATPIPAIFVRVGGA